MNDPSSLGLRILALLRSAPRPVKRREIAELCGPHGCKATTAERRVREALDWLVLQGYPVCSDGQGFRLAGDRKEWETALVLRERAVRSESLKLKRLRQMLGRGRMVFGRPAQQNLFGGQP